MNQQMGADLTVDEVVVELKRRIMKSEKPYDLDAVDRAIQLACKAHEGQKRSSGEDYVCHPLLVACILVDLGMDSETIVASILHDVVEDTPVELADVQKQFGADVAALVDGVTKLNKIPFSTKEEQQAENVRKMLLAMAQDIRVIIIKLADRLHNMRTIGARPPQKQRDKAKETMDIFAPLAHRLGIRAVKEELEDLSLRILDGVAYREIEDALALREGERNEFLNSIQDRIKERLAEFEMHPYVAGRIKSITGIYRKMFMQGKSFDEIYDIYAVRVIVDTVNDCYNVLGIIHDMYRPLPNRFKDYISTPKPNMYQSLHTTVIGKEGIPFEVQIRTWEMHHTAEYGIAAHWKYKLGISRGDSLEQRLSWIRQMLENQKESGDATDLVRTIKSDLAPEEVFVFTPKGEVINLPSGSTVIDFAYAIHSAVGNRMVGAKVDKKIVPIDYKVKTGEIIEILTTKEVGRGPSRDWLKIVKTSEARNKIRQWFKREKRDENIAEGKAELEREFKRNNIDFTEEELSSFLQQIGKKQSCQTDDDVYAAIGYGGIQLWKLMPKVREEYQKTHRQAKDSELPELPTVPEAPKKAAEGVIVDGMENCLIKFSRCCNPLPGDEIIGFITRGFGVSIHKRSCSNVPRKISEAAEPERWVNVHWAGTVKEDFKSTLEIIATDRSGLLADVTQQLFNMHIAIHSLNSRETKDGGAVITATITIHGLEHLQSIIARLSGIEGVYSVRRS